MEKKKKRTVTYNKTSIRGKKRTRTISVNAAKRKIKRHTGTEISSESGETLTGIAINKQMIYGRKSPNVKFLLR